MFLEGSIETYSSLYTLGQCAESLGILDALKIVVLNRRILISTFLEKTSHWSRNNTHIIYSHVMLELEGPVVYLNILQLLPY